MPDGDDDDASMERDGSRRLELHGSRYSRLPRTSSADRLDLEEFDAAPLPSAPALISRRAWCWAKVLLWGSLASAVVAALVVWVFPFLLDQVVIPLMGWETRTFPRPVLAVVLIGSLAFSPVLFMPSGPSMWLAGMDFGYGYGFLIIMTGTLIGISIPFFIARTLFRARIQRWIQKWPKRAAVIRIADQGDWFEQFRVLLILRISPIPYPLFNYAIATTNVKYGPYVCSSAIVLVPEAFITIYSGKLIKTLADIKNSRQQMTPFQIAYNALGFCMAVAVTIAITIHGKKALRELELKELAGKEECELPCRSDVDDNVSGSADAEISCQPVTVHMFGEEEKD